MPRGAHHIRMVEFEAWSMRFLKCFLSQWRVTAPRRAVMPQARQITLNWATMNNEHRHEGPQIGQPGLSDAPYADSASWPVSGADFRAWHDKSASCKLGV